MGIQKTLDLASEKDKIIRASHLKYPYGKNDVEEVTKKRSEYIISKLVPFVKKYEAQRKANNAKRLKVLKKAVVDDYGAWVKAVYQMLKDISGWDFKQMMYEQYEKYDEIIDCYEDIRVTESTQEKIEIYKRIRNEAWLIGKKADKMLDWKRDVIEKKHLTKKRPTTFFGEDLKYRKELSSIKITKKELDSIKNYIP